MAPLTASVQRMLNSPEHRIFFLKQETFILVSEHKQKCPPHSQRLVRSTKSSPRTETPSASATCTLRSWLWPCRPVSGPPAASLSASGLHLRPLHQARTCGPDSGVPCSALVPGANLDLMLRSTWYSALSHLPGPTDGSGPTSKYAQDPHKYWLPMVSNLRPPTWDEDPPLLAALCHGIVASIFVK